MSELRMDGRIEIIAGLTIEQPDGRLTESTKSAGKRAFQWRRRNAGKTNWNPDWLLSNGTEDRTVEFPLPLKVIPEKVRKKGGAISSIFRNRGSEGPTSTKSHVLWTPPPKRAQISCTGCQSKLPKKVFCWRYHKLFYSLESSHSRLKTCRLKTFVGPKPLQSGNSAPWQAIQIQEGSRHDLTGIITIPLCNSFVL